ncbi:probable gluconokinase isoform X2 [Boleophthalmus pectinirostris]|uniref:probable gluconokinase isoform X2 n=1 Tax=Boleophthalmus pectinirostris TaxID=150288 RepID=UPI00242D3033|nr:probable gluconokinase isoform X2 [Boleophthalmus pectinirostris]XP_055018036.1 probable gluconokinase isoform X2 [Boleophthalmus pectinirostris]
MKEMSSTLWRTLRRWPEESRSQTRFPWLLKLHEVIESVRCRGGNALVACSALKRLYRQILQHGNKAFTCCQSGSQQEVPPPPPLSSPDICFLFLHGDYNVIYQRLAFRKGHYMKANLLKSQFDTLEPPSAEENVLPLDITTNTITDMAEKVEKHLMSHKKLLLV